MTTVTRDGTIVHSDQITEQDRQTLWEAIFAQIAKEGART